MERLLDGFVVKKKLDFGFLFFIKLLNYMFFVE